MYKQLVFITLFFNASIHAMKHVTKQLCTQDAPLEILFPKKKLTQIAAEKAHELYCKDPIKGIEFLQTLVPDIAKHIAQVQDHNGDTLLHTVAYLGNEEYVDYLLDLGVNKWPRNKWCQTPIMLAAQREHITICKKLYTPCDYEMMEIEEFKRLLKYLHAIPGQEALEFVGEIDEVFDGDMFPQFCVKGDIEYLEGVLDYHEVIDDYRRKGLYKAVQAGGYEHVKLLLDHDKKHQWIGNDMRRYELLYEATVRGNPRIVWLLLNDGMKCDEALHVAVKNNNKKLAKMYCKVFNDSINNLDNSGKTALYYAVYFGYETLARLLLKKGAKPDVEGQEAYPLLTAVDCDDEKLVALLLNHGADIKIIQEFYFDSSAARSEIKELLRNYNIRKN